MLTDITGDAAADAATTAIAGLSLQDNLPPALLWLHYAADPSTYTQHYRLKFRTFVVHFDDMLPDLLAWQEPPHLVVRRPLPPDTTSSQLIALINASFPPSSPYYRPLPADLYAFFNPPSRLNFTLCALPPLSPEVYLPHPATFPVPAPPYSHTHPPLPTSEMHPFPPFHPAPTPPAPSVTHSPAPPAPAIAHASAPFAYPCVQPPTGFIPSYAPAQPQAQVTASTSPAFAQPTAPSSNNAAPAPVQQPRQLLSVAPVPQHSPHHAVASSSHVLRVPDSEKFDPTHPRANLDTWSSRMSMWLLSHNVSPDSVQGLATARIALADGAYDHVLAHELSHGPITSFQQLISILRAMSGRLDPASDARTTILRLRNRSVSDLPAYIGQYRRYANQLPQRHESDHLYFFLWGLHPSIVSQVRLAMPTTLDQAIALSTAVASSISQPHHTSAPTSYTASRRATADDMDTSNVVTWPLPRSVQCIGVPHDVRLQRKMAHRCMQCGGDHDKTLCRVLYAKLRALHGQRPRTPGRSSSNLRSHSPRRSANRFAAISPDHRSHSPVTSRSRSPSTSRSRSPAARRSHSPRPRTFRDDRRPRERGRSPSRS